MARAFVLIHAANGASGAVNEAVRAVPGVLSADIVSGAYDVIAEVAGTSPHQIQIEVVQRIEAIDGVLRAIACPTGSHEHLWEELLEPAYTGRFR